MQPHARNTHAVQPCLQPTTAPANKQPTCEKNYPMRCPLMHHGCYRRRAGWLPLILVSCLVVLSSTPHALAHLSRGSRRPASPPPCLAVSPLVPHSRQALCPQPRAIFPFLVNPDISASALHVVHVVNLGRFGIQKPVIKTRHGSATQTCHPGNRTLYITVTHKPSSGSSSVMYSNTLSQSLPPNTTQSPSSSL